MGAGRFVCVIVPFGLTIASIVCILIVMLAGTANKDLSMFTVDTKNFSISSNDLGNLAKFVKRDVDIASRADHFSFLTIAAQSDAKTLADFAKGTNITASTLGLADTYKINLWNYCAETGSKQNCTKAKFDWASDATNTTVLKQQVQTATGMNNVTLPREMKSALHTFSTVTKWTEVVYIIAIILGAAELVVGIFGFCSRVGSCITWLISGLATTSIIVASIMATAESAIVVGALRSTAKAYKLKASIDTSFLAVTWLAVAFSIGAGLFWAFSSCCCGADHHKKAGKRGSYGDREKLIPGAYQPIGEHHAFAGQQTGVFNTGGVPGRNNQPTRLNGAYEPYSHAAL